ncbi:hypothetical protein BKA69DRAFT_1041163 [Paraphysoderma sedebokerense]|nr:hypothetical protein BKA69DRAFT_1041163 [Paraphysoderma sedebokerense]
MTEQSHANLPASTVSDDPVQPSSLNDSRSGTSCNTLRVLKSFFEFSVLSGIVTVVAFLIGVESDKVILKVYRLASFSGFDLPRSTDSPLFFRINVKNSISLLRSGHSTENESSAKLCDIGRYFGFGKNVYPNLNQSQFAAFGDDSSWNSSEIRHIMFGLRVHYSRRADWERDYNMTITTRNYDHVDLSKDSRLLPIPVPDADVYFPAILKIDDEEPKPWLGDDLHEAPVARSAIEKAEQTRLAAISGQMPLVSLKKGIFIIHPLNITSPYIDANSGVLSGFMLAAYDSPREHAHKALFVAPLPSLAEFYDEQYSVNINFNNELTFQLSTDANNQFLQRYGYDCKDLLSLDSPIPVIKIMPSFHDLCTTSRDKFETDIRCANGRLFPAKVFFLGGTHDSSNQMPRYVMLIRDLTEGNKVLKELSDAKYEAQKANQAKTEILYFLSHEIRNPVHVILGLSDADDYHPNSEEANHDIYSAAKFLESLVEDILSLLNLRAGLLPMNITSFNLKEMIDSITEELKLPLAVKSLKFDLTVPSEDKSADIVTDEYRLRGSLYRILEHSIRVAPPHGNVAFSCFRYYKIFNPFDMDVSASQGEIFGGVGLGLVLANQYLKTLGAQLMFSSIKGRGNHVVIDIEFPVVNSSVDSCGPKARLGGATVDVSPRTETTSMPQGVSKDHSAANKTPRVLLVEDNAIVRKVTAKLLQKAACDVIIAHNGQEAIDIISRDNSIDLVLMDLIMPVLSGHDATVKLRSQNCRLPIIAVTANALNAEFERCKDEGFDDFVTKPASGETLRNIVQYWAGFRHESRITD